MRFLILLLLPAVLFAGQLPRTSPLSPIYNAPIAGGDEILTEANASVRDSYVLSLDEEQFTIGTTWYEYQHNGTAGKMLGVDETGWVHFVWMNGLDEGSAERHIYYNMFDPSAQEMVYENGVQVNSSQRAGYTCIVVRNDGFAFPTFHNKTETNQVFGHSTVAIDFLPQSGAFTTTEPERVLESNTELELDWPKSAIDTDGRVHIVATENPLGGDAGTPQRIYYARGMPQYDNSGFGVDIDWEPVGGDEDYLYIDTVMVIAADIACSRSENSDRVVISWSHSRDTLSLDPSQYNNDLYYMVSEDGGDNWGAPANVTNFEPPDWDCISGDSLECMKDTFRVYTDMSLILDGADEIHIAFTTGYLFQLDGLISIVYSDIWHWGELENYFSNIAHGYFEITDESPWIDPGAWQRVAQRPSLSIDETTNELYCSFQRYDENQTSSLGWPQADVWICKSTDNGIWWSEAVNLTETDGGLNAPTGESLSERDITLAETVTYSDGEGYLHMQYVLDREAGGSVQEEGPQVECPVIYSKINISEVPSQPLHNARYPQLRVDGTGLPPTTSADERGRELPNSFALYQNYPNPFNPATTIQFDLAHVADVSLKIFDVTGREVATLLNREAHPAGAHVVEFDGSTLASGVYFYSLNVNGKSTAKKMILMK